jgi:hypothetical protein
VTHPLLLEWPTPQQELLLRAALLPGARAAEAWERWFPQVDIDHLDPASDVMLSLLYRNLAEAGVDVPVMTRLKGVYRYHWVRNQVQLRRLAQTLALLRKHEVEVLVLERAALISLYYRDYGASQMFGLGLLANPRFAGPAQRVIGQDGWVPQGRLGGLSRFWRKRRFYRTADGTSLRLVWKSADERVQPDPGIWQRARRVEIEGIPVLARDPTGQLRETCLSTSVSPSLFWIADAVTILRAAGGEIDWEDLVARCGPPEQVARLCERLGYLHKVFEAQIPERILKGK